MNPEAMASAAGGRAASPAHRAFIPVATQDEVAAKLAAKHGAASADAIARGVRQVAERWWGEDGDAASFAAFCERHYLAE
ncbi:MAG TPA: hypothetical protein VI198_03005, partial [Candidatus Eisenbacteria bacterium]